jgi:hypothetical protein
VELSAYRKIAKLTAIIAYVSGAIFRAFNRSSLVLLITRAGTKPGILILVYSVFLGSKAEGNAHEEDFLFILTSKYTEGCRSHPGPEHKNFPVKSTRLRSAASNSFTCLLFPGGVVSLVCQ